MDAVAHAVASRIHEQTAQSRQPRHHHRRLARAGVAYRDASALFREREIRFCVRLSHPNIFVPWADRCDVSWADQQRGRYHSRPRRAATGAQSQRSPVVLHLLKDTHPRGICPDPMRAFCLNRELRPTNPRDVLDLPGNHAHDGVGRPVAWSGHFFARCRSENGRQHRPARPDSADHYGRSPHQV